MNYIPEWRRKILFICTFYTMSPGLIFLQCRERRKCLNHQLKKLSPGFSGDWSHLFLKETHNFETSFGMWQPTKVLFCWNLQPLDSKIWVSDVIWKPNLDRKGEIFEQVKYMDKYINKLSKASTWCLIFISNSCPSGCKEISIKELNVKISYYCNYFI